MSSDRDVRRPSSLRESGFTLVALMIVLIVLNVAVATAMQLWSQVAQREQEEELIFRGLQYAEAIRVFQGRFNRPPNSLEELMEVRPRVIRQLWKDPLSDSGAWEPILAGSGSDVTDLAPAQGPGQPASGQPTGRPLPGGTSPSQGGFGGSQPGTSFSGSGEELSRAFDEAGGFSTPGGRSSSFGGDAGETQVGPIEGVKPTATGESIKQFLGLSDYRSWEFRATMLAEPRVSPEGVPLMPRVDPSALGRPFPSWLSGAPGFNPHPVEGDTPPQFLPRDAGDSDDS